MSESSLSIEEEILSPDMFSEEAIALGECNYTNSDESTSSSNVHESEPSDDGPEWKGVSMDEIRRGHDIYKYQELPPISSSSSHTVLIMLPIPVHGPPKPYPTHKVDKWCQRYVRMPYSPHSMYPMDQNSGKNNCRNRWEIIQESLLRSFMSSQELETAILSYNHIYAQRWDFAALHHFFSETIDEEELKVFFEKLLPKMVQLALQLPDLITGAIPLLQRHINKTISLSQLQIASLLANAFFCTFPRRNSSSPQSEYAMYPYINFNRLYSAFKAGKPARYPSVMEKLKCFFHYFRRVTSKAPEGVITIERRYIPKEDCPKWDRKGKKMPLLHVTSKGTIENDGAGLLQVDFANRYLGGGVLGLGCVQEEIRFAICPELIVTMLVAEALDDTEALIISGVERYSKYEGYSNTFKWTGDYTDETPRDSSGRRMTSIVAIDALRFKNPATQFNLNHITRELNKAYVGFIGCECNWNNLPAIATGNWGCGAYRGNPKLKVLLQLIAAAMADRNLVYFTFGDTKLRDDIAEMYWHLVNNNVDTDYLFSLLVQYQEFATCKNPEFYRFLYSRIQARPLSKCTSLTTKLVESNSPFSHSTGDESSWDKQNIFKKSKSFQIDNKRTFSSNASAREQDADEERIRKWLAAAESDCKSKEKTEEQKDDRNKMKSIIDEYQDQARKNISEEVKRKNSQSKMQIRAVQERRLSGLDALMVVSDSCTIQDNTDLTVKTDANEPEHSTRDQSAEPIKRDSLVIKKTNQRKISDFFQRTS